ncbi:hypothetical protein AZH46_06310 [Corynebacterium striatum]|nr:hypothetical protein AZH46_06310 [Corynebacterium striatum]PXY15302.1 hypothetical protein CKF74_00895 [Corynebacterium striatum]PXY16236.1 hypothetical protein CKF62_01420 [Corynebacterium striatum]
MGLMQDKLADDLRDCLRVAAVQVCGRAVLAETNHVFHAGFVRRSAVLQHPIAQVELDQGKRRARFVGISSRDHCAIAVAQRDLSTPGTALGSMVMPAWAAGVTRPAARVLTSAAAKTQGRERIGK